MSAYVRGLLDGGVGWNAIFLGWLEVINSVPLRVDAWENRSALSRIAVISTRSGCVSSFSVMYLSISSVLAVGVNSS